MKDLWTTISTLGVVNNDAISERTSKRLIFFNQVLFIGIFATLSQIVFVWPYIGIRGLLFLIVCAALILSLILNSRGKHSISKWIYVIVVNTMGTYTTLLLGGAALYHIQAVLILVSCLIMFDFKTEKTQIFVGVPFMVASIAIGEFGLLGVPDFSSHFWTESARIANISSLVVINVAFISFILKINDQNEEKLTRSKKSLEKGKGALEVLVLQRTAELEAQKEELIRQNKDKEILLKEVHHRVRNNLQIITSLVNLQMAKIEEPATESALVEIQSRVASMSLVHKRMYETSDFQKINVREYIQHIAENMRKIYGQGFLKLRLQVPESFAVQMEYAIPFGLITNEILANYFKHGRAANAEDDVIGIQVQVIDEQFQFTYKDNGSGFPEGLELERLDSLGLMLIDSLVEQLDGTVEFYNDGGAVYSITVPMLM